MKDNWIERAFARARKEANKPRPFVVTNEDSFLAIGRKHHQRAIELTRSQVTW